jgi:hypothetical protein
MTCGATGCRAVAVPCNAHMDHGLCWKMCAVQCARELCLCVCVPIVLLVVLGREDFTRFKES